MIYSRSHMCTQRVWYRKALLQWGLMLLAADNSALASATALRGMSPAEASWDVMLDTEARLLQAGVGRESEWAGSRVIHAGARIPPIRSEAWSRHLQSDPTVYNDTHFRQCVALPASA